MIIDFTDCQENVLKTYNGANGSKRCIIFNGEKYMLKFPAATKINKSISYSNSVISEYIGSSIYNILGIPAQKTMLGIYRVNDKIKRVVACKDFEIDGYRLYDFASIKNTIIRDTPRSGYGTDLLEVLETIREQKIYNPEELSNFFWNMFIVDAYIGNFDRHNGNWGFLINEDNKDVKIAPIYDCGSCLFAEMDTEKKKEVMTKKQELEHRIYNIPRSSLMLKDKKLKYYDFLSSNLIPECTDALYRMNDIIDDNEPMITDMINEIEITQVEKDFYIFMLNKRKEMILEQAIQNIEQNKKNDIDMFDK